MPSKYGQDSIARSTYIPPQIKQAMDKQAAQTLPPHLQQYVGPNKPAYIPKGVEARLTQHLQSTMPAHMGQYANAYVQQNVTAPNVSRTTASLTPHAPIPDRLRLDHAATSGSEQHTVDLNALPVAAGTRFTTPDGNAQLPPNLTGGSAQEPTPGTPDYGFIMTPPSPPKAGFSLPSLPGLGSFSLPAYGVAGLIILVILFNVISGVLKGPSIQPQLMAVAEDQQAIVHILTASAQYQDISGSYTNYSATANLVLPSNQSLLFKYMILNKMKVDTRLLSAKVSLSNDKNLQAAEDAGTLNQLFGQLNNSLLDTYKGDLATAYKAAKGPKGRGLLKSEYAQAVKLQTQLNGSYQ